MLNARWLALYDWRGCGHDACSQAFGMIGPSSLHHFVVASFVLRLDWREGLRAEDGPARFAGEGKPSVERR